MTIHGDESKAAYLAAAQALREVKEARQLVAEASRQKAKPDLSAIGRRSPKPKATPEPELPTSSFDPTGGLRGIGDWWKARGKGRVEVDVSSTPAGVDSVLPAGAKVYDARQKGDRDEEAIVAPAREKALRERRELVERVQREQAPEKARIEAEKEAQLQAALDYWEGR